VGGGAEPRDRGAAGAHRGAAGGIPRASRRTPRRWRKATPRELARSNQWAEALNREIGERGARIVELQEEFAREQHNGRQVAEGYAAKVAALERDIQDKTKWAIDTETNLTAVIREQTERLSGRWPIWASPWRRCTTPKRNSRSAPRGPLRLQDEARQLEEQVALFRASVG